MTNEVQHVFREMVPGYALDALEAEEKRRFEKHLRGCGECQGLLEEYRATADGLLLSLPPRLPPSRVRARLIASLASARPAPSASRPHRWPVGQLASGLALALLLALNLWTAAQLRDVKRQQALLQEQLRSSQTALALQANPQARTLTVSGERASGSLVLNPQQNTGVLFAWGLEPLDTSSTYQAWLIRPDGSRVSAGLFRPEPNQDLASLVIVADSPLSDFVALGVTIEPQGGSPAPTGRRVLETEF